VLRVVLPALPAGGAATTDFDAGMSHLGFRCVRREEHDA
jgi:hypothetical protein